MPDMSAAPLVPIRGTSARVPRRSTSPPRSFLRKYVFSLDHKVIGKQYLDLALAAVAPAWCSPGSCASISAFPDAAVPGLGKLAPNAAAGGIMTPELYLSLMTMHGTLMVFFVLTTAPFAGFGNFVLPLQVGAEDMAFPRFNMMSFWVTFLAFLVLIAAFFVPEGPPLSGWTAYAPLSAIGKDAGPGQGTGQTLWVVSIALFCVGQLLGALNFIATTLDLRTKGMTLSRMPFSTWAWFITSVIGTDRVFGAAAGVCPAPARPAGRHQLLHPGRAGRERQAAAALGRLAPPLAALVLVLRPS